jgi:Uma2 family endonuclease
VAVTCAPPGPEQWCPDPALIVEVLSPSTEGDHRDVKPRAYHRLASVQDTLLVASGRPAVEH